MSENNLIHTPVVLDIAGTRLTAADRHRLQHPLVGGLILFTRNWQDCQQLAQLCADIKQVRPDVLIAVDHEGGRVQRFRTDGLTHLPPMASLGQMWASAPQQALQAATACGYVLAAELRACGVDFSFTPVLDLNHGQSTVIGDRAFGRDPLQVAILAQSLMQGLRMAGMASCGKHFPGHGFVQADSHVAVPVDARPLQAILQDDAQPYVGLRHSLTSVMPAHVIYPEVDALPAGFSSRWLQTILRQQLGFDGVIFSDDLSMEGARVLGGQPISFTQSALLALHAGCDRVLLCNQSLQAQGQPIDDILEGLVQAQQQGLWTPSLASAQRCTRLMPTSKALTFEQLQSDHLYGAAKQQVEALKAAHQPR